MVIRSSLRDSLPVSQTLGRPYCSFPLVRKSLIDLFLIPIIVDLFPVVSAVLSSVISDVFLVPLIIGSLAADELFLVNFIPSSTSGFGNLGVLCLPLFSPG